MAHVVEDGDAYAFPRSPFAATEAETFMAPRRISSAVGSFGPPGTAAGFAINLAIGFKGELDLDRRIKTCASAQP